MTSNVSRREFVQVCVAAGVAAGMDGAGGLPTDQRTTLLAVAKTIFPHPGATDRPYQAALDGLALRCRSDARARWAVAIGVTALHFSAGPRRFEGAQERDRITCLKKMERTRFYQIIYSELLDGMYGAGRLGTVYT